jgi:hypothetical protein
MIPWPCWRVFSKLDGLTRFPAPLLPAPRNLPARPLILATHAGLGLLLVAFSLWLAVLAIRGRRPPVTWAAILGAQCILGVGFNGGSIPDYNKDVSSYIMALLFAAAVLCYAVILALPGGPERRTPAG